MTSDWQPVLTRNFVDRPEGPLTVAEYESRGGYQALRKTLRELSPLEVQQQVIASGLRGRGGAGFPTGRKWGFLPMGDDAPHPKYLICNADEMEPGSFKDAYLMKGDPHQLIEGILIAAYAMQMDFGFIFIRWAYTPYAGFLERAVHEAERAGYLGPNILGSGWGFHLHVHTSAGRYICGEETATLNALEGKRPIPRAKPPHPPQHGLWGQPTIINNVETLVNLPHIVSHGPEWFQSLGRGEDAGTKIYAVTGRVKAPGCVELPMGVPLRELIFEHAGGMQDGYRLRAAIPGGASTPYVTAEEIDVPMDFEGLKRAGSRLGTGCVIVIDDRTCLVGATLNLARFFARESCGWCTPCRDGLPWLVELLTEIEEGRGTHDDLELLAEQASIIGVNSFCAHAEGACEPLRSAIEKFRGDFEQHIREQRCPWRDGRADDLH
jgi:NADH-quinone oxidoreductase subunit F